ncbi:hypothetical protein GDO86_014927 [Hymenochirus boettgeri]|uniref:Pyroglutamylated RFamide peptide n=1 Tax=Hymenochirus boettgeri TaxID=247094 RepID=A0A8T2JVH0_9PIPI|nr:hypothetical protein GDO86_014927 [Hymenochirus boettgeri]
MKVNYGLSVWLLLSLGSILALQDSRQQTEPWGRIGLLRMFPDEVENGAEALLYTGESRERKSMDPASLFIEGNEIEDFGGQEEEKRDGTALGSLAEELNGFNRKKGGFSFRFGKR